MCDSQPEFLRHLLGADRRADLREEAMRLAELALAGGVIAAQPRELGTLDVKERLVALRARHLEPGVGFGERDLDLSRRLKALDLTESADPGEQSREFPESGAEPAADGGRFRCESQGPFAIAETELRCRHSFVSGGAHGLSAEVAATFTHAVAAVLVANVLEDPERQMVEAICKARREGRCLQPLNPSIPPQRLPIGV